MITATIEGNKYKAKTYWVHLMLATQPTQNRM